MNNRFYLFMMLMIFISFTVISMANTPAIPLSECSIILDQVNSFQTVGNKIGLVDIIKQKTINPATRDFDGVATKYNSTKLETVRFAGAFKSTDSNLIIGIFSDDGVTVKIDGQVQNVNNFGQGQALPNFENFSSLKNLDGPWKAQTGVAHYMEIEYSNICHPDDTDIDGLTVYFCGQASIVPITITLNADKTTILTGGINNSLHKATVTATVVPANIKGEVLFSFIQGKTGVNIESKLSVDSCPLSNGLATTVLTSSDLASSEDLPTIIRASIGGCSADINIIYDVSIGDCRASSDTILVNGTSTLTLHLTYNNQEVVGHNIQWRIKEIYDIDQLLIYDSENGFDNTDGKNYGSISPALIATGPNGVSTSIYTAGTEGGLIVFEALDMNTYCNE